MATKNFHLMRRRGLLLLAGFSALTIPAAASAQTDAARSPEAPQDQPAAGQGGEQIQDIVVTAQRREESLQRVPVSIKALDSATLTQAGVRDLADVATLTPNVNISSAVTLSGSSVASSAYIRGVGQSDFLLTTDPGVGLYLDGVYIARSVGSLLDVVDVSRIEVLRGPQGTLYGKNTIGGAINVVTERPRSDRTSGYIRGLVGSYDRLELVGSLNLPLAQRAALRVTAADLNQDGYVTLVPSGKRLGNRDRWTVRGALALDLGDRLSLDMTADYLKAREEGGASTLAGINPNGVQVIANARIGEIYDQRYLPSSPLLAFGDPQVSNSDIYGVSGTAEWRIGDGVTAKSITSYRGYKSFFTRDGDQSPLLLLYTQSEQKQSQFTQEVQLVGSLLSDDLKYLIGGFYGDEQGQDLARLQTRQVTVNIGGYDIDTRSYAAFGQATLSATEELSLTGGIRWTRDRKTYSPDIFIAAITPGTGGPPPVLIGRPIVPTGKVGRTFEKVTYRLAGQYQWTPTFMTYVSYSTGFKSGGFVQRNATTLPALPSFGPENVRVLEGGVKLDAFDRRLRLSAAGFLNWYDDLQITVLQPSGLINPVVTANAGKARINGFEADAQAIVGGGFSLIAGIGYLDAGYTAISPNAVGITLNSKLVRAPRWSGNLSLLHDVAVGNGTLATRLDMTFSSRVFYDTNNLSSQGAYGVFNGTINYTPSGRGLTFTVGGRNLLDKRYFVSADNKTVPGDVGTFLVTYARPREFYGQIIFRF